MHFRDIDFLLVKTATWTEREKKKEEKRKQNKHQDKKINAHKYRQTVSQAYIHTCTHINTSKHTVEKTNLF